MNFAGGFTPIPYDHLFAHSPGEKIKRESWGFTSSAQPNVSGTHRRARPRSILAKKRAKMTRGDELISDEKTRKVATEILDQIQNTPGRIWLDFQSSESVNLCPLPLEFGNTVTTDWSTDKLQEGQLSIILGQNPQKFKNLKIPGIRKGDVKTEILPRQQTLKQSVEILKKTNNSEDNYIQFSIAVANVLRKCEAEKAEIVAQSIGKLIEEQVLSNNN